MTLQGEFQEAEYTYLGWNLPRTLLRESANGSVTTLSTKGLGLTSHQGNKTIGSALNQREEPHLLNNQHCPLEHLDFPLGSPVLTLASPKPAQIPGSDRRA